MIELKALEEQLAAGRHDQRLASLYGGGEIAQQRERFLQGLKEFRRNCGEQPVMVFSAPGRTELGGNHTDHNGGRVLAGAIQLDSLGIAAPRSDSRFRLWSEGYPFREIDLNQLSCCEDERESTAALVRGIAQRMTELGYRIGGADCYITSRVLRGSGLSSSASIEILLVSLFSGLFNENRMDSVEAAMIGQYAENRYFGKPSGLMDQIACAHGGIVCIDFKQEAEPVIESVDFPFLQKGYRLAVVDTRAHHADLSDEYAAVPREMAAVAEFFGVSRLREVPPSRFLQEVAKLRGSVGDRAVLRSFHFLRENQRVFRQYEALREGKLEDFLREAGESGNSSYKYLQNISCPGNPSRQELAVALALSEDFLAGSGACRVHGGGFGGTILAFVPGERFSSYRSLMDGVFGEGAVTPLRIRGEAAGPVFT